MNHDLGPDIDEIPYGAIASAIQAGQVVPFLGAGASAVYRDEPAWHRGAAFLPFGAELASDLAGAGAFPDDDARGNLPLVASFYEHVAADRGLLNAALRDVFAVDCRPGSVHRLLARAPRAPCIVTTNYDDLMERALGDRPYCVVVDRGERTRVWVAGGDGRLEPVQANKLREALQPDDRPIVFKMHGCLVREQPDMDAFLVTEQEYVDFLGRGQTCLPPYLAARLQKVRFLFIGYSLADWNVRVLLRKLRQGGRGDGGGRRSWAVSRRPGPAERRIWEAHGVNMYDADLKEFVARLAQELGIAVDDGD